jgi:hypothetical protein
MSKNVRKQLADTLRDAENKILRDILNKPTVTYQQIGARHGVSRAFVSRIAYKYDAQRSRGGGSAAHPKHGKGNVNEVKRNV